MNIETITASRNKWMKAALDSVVLNNEDFTLIGRQEERIAELEAALQEVIYHFESGNGDHSDLNDGMIPKLKELINGQWSETK